MISIEEFAERLLHLGAGRDPRPMPRKRRDREILMKSLLMTLDSEAVYSEREVNELIEAWKSDGAPALETDHVTVRRMLVDYGLLERTPDGGRYRVGFPPRPLAFDLEVDELDVRATVAAYREQQARRPRRRPGRDEASAGRTARRPRSLSGRR